MIKQHGIFVTGTDTDVGKTYVGQALVYALTQQGLHVRVRKPVESGWPTHTDTHTTDAALLSQATTQREPLSIVCPNTFKAAISPARAATLEGKTLSVAQLKQQCLTHIEATDFLYVEGAGGFYSPLVSDGLNADLAQQLALPLLLIAEDKLGCINQVLLTLEAINQRGLTVLAVVLNKKNSDHKMLDDCAMNNLEELAEYTNTPVFSYAYGQSFVPLLLLRLMMA